jgi:hypothetical protein
MLKVYYRNKFRIRNKLTGKVLNLKQDVDRNGNDIWISGFTHRHEVETELNRFLQFNPQYKEYLEIETYSDKSPQYHSFPKDVSNALEKRKFFSGKGLAENAAIPKRHENRYAQGKWYSREIRLAQSVEFNKGLSLIHKLKDKSSTKNKGAGTITFQRMEKHALDTAFVSHDVTPMVKSLFDDGTLKNRLDAKKWLKERSYSVKAINRILYRVFNCKNITE